MGEYRSGRTLALVVSVFLYARVGTDLFALAGQAVVTFGLRAHLETFADETNPTFLAAVLLMTLGGLGQLVAFVGAAVSFLWWFHRAATNAHRLASDVMRYSPGWAIGAFFVPLLNLARPYQIARDIEAVGSRWRNHSRILGVWWGAFVLDNLLTNLELRYIDETSALDVTFGVMVVTSITGAVAAFFCFRSVWYLEGLLADRARSPEDVAAVFS